MEQIDAQVSDLRYLTQASVPLPSEASTGYSPPVSATPGDNSAPLAGARGERGPSAASVGREGRRDDNYEDIGDDDDYDEDDDDDDGRNRKGSRAGGAPAGGGAKAGAKSGSKRKADEDGSTPKQQRSKRNRYISIACNECKRRKIKCNGETPCQRCGNLNLSCLYAPNCCSNSFRDSDEFKKMSAHMLQLQDQVDGLVQSVGALRSEAGFRLAPIQDRSGSLGGGGSGMGGGLGPGIGAPPAVPLSASISPSPATSLSSLHKPDLGSHGRQASFRGPTSMAYSLDVANNTIHEMGYKGIGDSGGGDDVAPPPPPPPHSDVFAVAARHHSEAGYLGGLSNSGLMLSPVEPLWEFDRDELVRLCRAHDEEVGIMYPVVNIQTVIGHARALSQWMEAQRRRGAPPTVVNDDKTLVLKMVMCCALAVEEHGQSDKALRVYESCEAVINRKLMADACDVANLPLLALVAGYRFLSNDEILAWRVMGQVVRLCLEMGIHRRSGLMKIQVEEERRNALNSFWSAYVLDRRWAFGTGLPYVVQDNEVDPELPMPDEFPYLVAMITYSRLGAKVWQQVSHFGPVLARELRQEEMESLDQQILRWYETVPEEVKLRNWDKEKKMTSTPSYNLQRLRIWTYLRFNQIRIWLYTPVLHSATSIMSNPAQAQRVVDLARDTIRYLTHLNNTTNLYRKIQVFYHQFLTSAISVLFLASVHAPVRFSGVCRDEFYMALELVRDLSAKSWVSQRLWRTIGSLKEVAPRVGLRQRESQRTGDGGAGRGGADEDAHSSAALAMAGLASGRMVPGTVSGPGMGVAPGQGLAVAGPYARQSTATPGSASTQTATGIDAGAGGGGGAGGRLSPDNGARIQTEMTRIFENYLGMNGFPLAAGDEVMAGAGAGLPTPDSAGLPPATYGPNGTLYSHFSEMY